jgi:hypothetical protein
MLKAIEFIMTKSPDPVKAAFLRSKSTYQSAWMACPVALRKVVETGIVPNPEVGD